MRRVLLLCLVMSLGGCWCFDRAYLDFCADTGRCNFDDAGASFGNVARIELKDVPVTLEAGICWRARVEFINRDSVVTAADQPGSVQLTASPGVHLFATADCMGQGIAGVPFGADEDNVQFWFNADHFGTLSITATLAPLTPFQTSFLSTAKLRIVPAPVAVRTTNCEGAFLVEAWSSANASPVKAAASVAVDVVSPMLSFGSSCTIPGSTQVTIPGFASSTVVFARMSPDAGIETVSVTSDETAGLLGAPQTDVYPDCLPLSVACSSSANCCAGLSCTASTCGM